VPTALDLDVGDERETHSHKQRDGAEACIPWCPRNQTHHNVGAREQRPLS
jgi:hypothetical protein